MEPSPSPVLHYPCLDAYSHGQATNSVNCAGTHTLSVTLLRSRVIPHSGRIWPPLCRTGQEMLITLAHLSRQVPSATLTQNKQPIPPPKNMEPKLKKYPTLFGKSHSSIFPRPVALPGPKLVQQTLVPTLAPAPGPAERLLFTEKSTEIEVSCSTPGGFGLMALFLLQGGAPKGFL